MEIGAVEQAEKGIWDLGKQNEENEVEMGEMEETNKA